MDAETAKTVPLGLPWKISAGLGGFAAACYGISVFLMVLLLVGMVSRSYRPRYPRRVAEFSLSFGLGILAAVLMAVAQHLLRGGAPAPAP